MAFRSSTSGLKPRRQRPLSASDPRTPTGKRQGLSRAAVAAAAARQHGLCLICEKPLGAVFAVDHCHACAEAHGHDPNVGCPRCFRCLLCPGCNGNLGWFEKRPSRVLAVSAHGVHGRT